MDDPQTQAASGGPLKFLTPRDSKRAAKARGQRRVIGRLKVILPVISGIVLVGLVVWPMINPNKIITKAMKNIPDIMIENITYSDVDSNQQPYTVSAAKARRPGGAANVFDLDQPQAEITLKEGTWIATKSVYGRYNRDTSHLWLGGDVRIYHDKGYQFTTDELQVDLQGRNAWGEKPVLIQGGFGEIRGIGFQMMDSGNIIVVKGPATALLNLQSGPASVKPSLVVTKPK
jgi:lipopolysaccharide export system protein LptC